MATKEKAGRPGSAGKFLLHEPIDFWDGLGTYRLIATKEKKS
jgi:hypothetical protein